METIDMQALAAIARRAGDEIMAVYATDFDVRGKADASPVTEADERAEALIVPAGSVVAFTSYNLHRSGANTTNRMRRIYLPQYSCEPITRPDGKPWAMAVPFLKDGQVVYDHARDAAENYGPFPETAT